MNRSVCLTAARHRGMMVNRKRVLRMIDGSSRQIHQDNIGILLLPIENNLLSV